MLNKYFNVVIIFIMTLFFTNYSHARVLFPTYHDRLINSPFWICEVLQLKTCKVQTDYIRRSIRVGFLDTGLNTNLSFLKDRNIRRTYNPELGNLSSIEDLNGHGTSVVSVFLDTLDRIEAYTGTVVPLEIDIVKTIFDYNSKQQASSHGLRRSWAFLLIDSSMDIINVSLEGGEYVEDEHKVIQYSYYESNSLIVVAAGNYHYNLDKTNRYPCSYNVPNIICVGNMSKDNHNTSSNYGYDVDVLINGENIRAISHTGQYRTLSGTSFSTPQISAYLAYARYAFPRLSRTQIKQCLLDAVEEKDLCLYSKSCGIFSFNKFVQNLKSYY